MKKLTKILCLVMALSMVCAVPVMAANKNSIFSFQYDGQKRDSDPNPKERDNDYNAYITTTERDGYVFESNVFEMGGTFLARTRLQSNASGVYSPLFTFTSYGRQVKTYGSGMAKFGENYIVRAEVDNTSSNNARQSIRWAP